jgi:hypothetical protein
VPDIAGNASAVSSGYDLFIYGMNLSDLNTAPTVAGTSAVAPLYAGLMALINANIFPLASIATTATSVGFLNPSLYGMPASWATQVFNDVNNGRTNRFDNVPGYSTTAGWDPCTGWGSVNGGPLADFLLVNFVEQNPGCLATTSTSSTTTTTTVITTSTTATTGLPRTTSTSTTTTSNRSTTEPSVVTTTTLPAGCDGPRAATYISIDCRLDALIAQLSATPDVHAKLRAALRANLQQARDQKQKAEHSTTVTRAVLGDLKQARREMISFSHRIRSLAGGHKIHGDTGPALASAGDEISSDLRTLRDSMHPTR